MQEKLPGPAIYMNRGYSKRTGLVRYCALCCEGLMRNEFKLSWSCKVGGRWDTKQSMSTWEQVGWKWREWKVAKCQPEHSNSGIRSWVEPWIYHSHTDCIRIEFYTQGISHREGSLINGQGRKSFRGLLGSATWAALENFVIFSWKSLSLLLTKHLE